MVFLDGVDCHLCCLYLKDTNHLTCKSSNLYCMSSSFCYTPFLSHLNVKLRQKAGKRNRVQLPTSAAYTSVLYLLLHLLFFLTDRNWCKPEEYCKPQHPHTHAQTLQHSPTCFHLISVTSDLWVLNHWLIHMPAVPTATTCSSVSGLYCHTPQRKRIQTHTLPQPSFQPPPHPAAIWYSSTLPPTPRRS